MSRLFDYSDEELVACVRREISLRERVYPRWVEEQRMTQKKADHELGCMRAVLDRLEKVAAIDDVMRDVEP